MNKILSAISHIFYTEIPVTVPLGHALCPKCGHERNAHSAHSLVPCPGERLSDIVRGEDGFLRATVSWKTCKCDLIRSDVDLNLEPAPMGSSKIGIRTSSFKKID